MKYLTAVLAIGCAFYASEIRELAPIFIILMLFCIMCTVIYWIRDENEKYAEEMLIKYIQNMLEEERKVLDA